MYNYDKHSRKGLVEMATDFDKASDGALGVFVDESDKDYALVTPAELLCENFEERKSNLVEALKSKIDDAANVVDTVIAAIANPDEFINDDVIDVEIMDEVANI